MVRKITSVRTFLFVLSALLLVTAGSSLAFAERPHGLEPADDMPYIPDLGGVRHKSYKNQYAFEKHLSEAIVLRQSKVENGVATVPAGGLYYISEVLTDSAPLRRDPMFLLGEHSYLLTMKTHINKVENFTLKRGDKKLVDDAGYRLWFDYATDHYQKPYNQLALIAPSGHWPLEFPVSTKFKQNEDILKESFTEGHNEQLWDFYLSDTYEYGMSVFKAADTGFQEATFEHIHYPVVDEATFSLTRPCSLELRQEDYRWYGSKRIYAFRQPNGFLVRVTNWSGDEVLAEKLVRPITPQGTKDRNEAQEQYYLHMPEHDMHVEIHVQPEFLENSDFNPTTMAQPYGWPQGVLTFVVYSDLMALKNGQPWPLDDRYNVGLEANLMTGKLQRVVIENAKEFKLDESNCSYDGPTKFSHFWNRAAFSVVVDEFATKMEKNRKTKKEEAVSYVDDYYVRDYYGMRTDNLAFFAKTPTKFKQKKKMKGRKDIDFFIGRAPTLAPILEDTFLTRLADKTLDIVVEPSHFTSYPRVISDAAFFAPDMTAPFVPSLKGFNRKPMKNNRKEKVTSAEGLVIRGSYVDYENGKVVIPPHGLYYTSRNSRNVRPLMGETFYLLGEKAYLASFKSTTLVRKNFDIDFWRFQPDGGFNPIYWQDEQLGKNNKQVRYLHHAYLDDRVMGEIFITKYSGNNFGAPFHLAFGFDDTNPDKRYDMPEVFVEGSTWTIPQYIGQNYVRMGEMGTPMMTSFTYTYKKPKMKAFGAGDTAKVGKYTMEVMDVDTFNKSATIALKDKSGAVVASKMLGPLDQATFDMLPQHKDAVYKLQLSHEDVMVEMEIDKTVKGDKINLRMFTEVEEYKVDEPMKEDPRYTIRPDVCGHCYMLNEVLMDNNDPIILDADNPVYEGPKKKDGQPMFRIVLDDFDGEFVQSWHIESPLKTKKGNIKVFKTDNLAFNHRNNVDVLVGANGTIEGFLRLSMVNRMAYMEYWRRGLHPPLHFGDHILRTMQHMQ